MSDKSFGERRAEASGDNTLWTPADCLRCALREIESGETEADTLYILALKKEEDGSYTRTSYRCGINNLESLGVLSVIQQIIADGCINRD